MELPALMHRARRSALARWWLNLGLRRMIPFNRPHGFRVTPLPEGGMRVDIPFRKLNRNHIRGTHACCLATGAELCSGLALMENVDPRRYRIIMQELRMRYHFQAKAHAHASFAPTEQELGQKLLGPLAADEVVTFVAVVPVHDAHGNHVATGTITWQIKPWAQVRTKG